MYLKSSYETGQLRDYSTLFLRSEVNRVLENDFSSINLKVKKYDGKLLNKEISYLKYLEYIYKVLERNYPNEYIYKNEFLNQWLKKELGSNNSILFNEFRIGKATADLALFNGSSKVFEIKTLLDSDYRLSNQLEEYKKLFNEIYLIIPHSLESKYLAYDGRIGIISYAQESRLFRKIRGAESNNEPDFSIIMDVLHTREYKEMVEVYYGSLPEMTDFTQFEICKELIDKIPSRDLNSLFVNTMKKRKINNLFYNRKGNELNQVSLSMNLNEKQLIRLIDNLNTTIKM